MNCKLNIKADNGANSKLYLDILADSKNPKQAVDTYFYTKTKEFKKFYQGTLDENGEPVYSQFSQEAYVHEADFNNIELENSAEVYKKLLDDVPKLMDVLSARIDYLRNSGSKDHIKQLTDIYTLLETQPINTSIPRFIEMSKGHVFNLKRAAEKAFADPASDIRTMASYYKISQSYSILSDLKQALTLDSEVGEIFDEQLNSMSTVIDNINTIENLYINKSIDFLTEEFHKRDQTWSKRKIKEELRHSKRDIDFLDQMMEYTGDSSDRVISMVARVMMEAEHKIRRQGLDFAKELEAQLVKLESKYNREEIFNDVIVKAATGDLHVVDLNAKFTDGKSKLSDTMAARLKEIQGKPELMEFLQFYHTTMQGLEASLPFNARLGTRLPTVLKSEFELLQGKSIKDKASLVGDNVSKKLQRSTLDMEKGVLLDSAGKPVKRIPTFYTQRYDSADYDLEFRKVKDKLIKEGMSEEDASINADAIAQEFATTKMASLISTDLVNSLQAFHAMATNYAAKNELIHIFESAEAVVGSKQRTYTLVDSGGRTLINRNTKREKTITGEEATAPKVLATFLEMQLYGQKEKDLGFTDLWGYKVDINKTLRAINNYTGLTMQAANIMGGISNMTVGEYNNIMEGISKEYYSTTDYAKASGFYKNDIFNIVSDIGSRTPSSIVNLIETHYNILQSHGKEKLKTSERSRIKRLMSTDSLYFMQASGEHSMQLRAGMAVMNATKMYNAMGQEQGSLLDNHTVEEGKLVVPNKLFIKEKDGSLVPFDTNQQNRISNKIGALLRKMHGNYSAHTATKMQQDARTAMMMKFRGWLAEGIKRRYAKKRDYHMLEVEMEGFYRTGGRALAVLAKDLKSLSLQLSKENWRKLTPHEKANIRRFVTETSMIIATGVAGAILANAGKMMEDKYDTDDMGDRAILGAYQMLNYQVNRLYTEVFAYINLQEFVKLMATPAASVSLVESTIRVLQQFSDPFEEYQAGWRKGENKLLVKTEKLIPLYKQLTTLNADGIKARGMYFINNN